MAQRIFLNLNGKIIDASQPLFTVKNRSFRYGDSIFESFRAFGQEIPFFKSHFDRLLSAMNQLGMNVPVIFSEEFLLKEIRHLLRVNKFFKSAVIRFTVFRNDGGKYFPETNAVSYLIETMPLSENSYVLNNRGLSIGVFSDFPKAATPFSSFKSANAQIYIAAALCAQESGWDDALLLNAKNEIMEATSSNVFFVRDNFLFTPSSDSGIIRGIMRQKVIEVALQNKFVVYDEVAIRENEIGSFDEIFLTNSVKGIQWVSGYKDFRFFKKTATLLTEKLNQSLQN